MSTDAIENADAAPAPRTTITPEDKFARIEAVLTTEQKKMLAWLLCKGCTREDAEDVFQDFLLKLWRSTRPLPADGTELVRFLWTCLKNACFTSLTKRLPIDDAIDGGKVIDQQAEEPDQYARVVMAERLECCRSRVAEREWECFEHRMSGMTQEEAAAEMKCTICTVRSYESRVNKACRDCEKEMSRSTK